MDTSPDLRAQLIDAEVDALDAVLFTHEHADHTHGIDDLRALVLHRRARLDAWMDERTAAYLISRFNYVFETPEGSDYPPILNAMSYEWPSTDVRGIKVSPFLVPHGNTQALGLRFGEVCYLPDVSAIPDHVLPNLIGLDLLILDALRWTPHPSHLSVEQALSVIERARPKRTVLTNLHVDLDYDELSRVLPSHATPAYDGMVLTA